MIGRAGDAAAVKNVLAKVVPEVNKSMAHVDGMLADLLEVGSTSTQLIQEPVSPETLVEQTLGEIFRVYPKANVSINYAFSHTHAVDVHVQKVGRVFSNIVGNAVQAMGYKGGIWFATREIEGMVEFTVGNSGSIIPSENLAKLFEAFFTSGKKGGTGLGLAIAQKVVTAHGGKIWCESDRTAEHPDGHVEFKFTLPTAVGQAMKTAVRLPNHSSEITKDLLEITEHESSPSSKPDAIEIALEANIAAMAKSKGRPVRVLVVDDEGLYRAALALSLARSPELAESVSVIEAQDKADAMVKFKEKPDLVITDVDMGQDFDGFDLVSEIKSKGFSGLICVHSNRMIPEDHRTALEKGADAFIPKPIARAQLLKLIIQAGKRTDAVRQGAVKEEKIATPAKPEVLILDDNLFVLEAWQAMLEDDAVVHTIASHEELIERMENEPSFLSRLSTVVTDFHFDGSRFDGQDIAQLIKQHQPSLKVLLSSDGLFSGKLVGPDSLIGKNPVTLDVLLRA